MRALLMLDDGLCFEGTACGACQEAEGEVVFTTGMAGFQETLTDPSYHGQMVAFTAAHVGNYGATPLDDESPLPQAAGAIFHELFVPPAGNAFPHWRAEESLHSLLARAGITGITGVDTRALTLHLRASGARGGVISALDLDKESLLRRARAVPPMGGRDLTGRVSCAEPYSLGSSTPVPVALQDISAVAPLRVAVMDYGVKRSILTGLARQGMDLTVWPGSVDAKDILAARPHGVLLSNGPGDPEPCFHAIRTIRALLGRVPLFGICLGHQLLALALGAKTFKLPFGHHGVNHPVRETDGGRVYITSQNHGFCVDPDSLPPTARPSHWNLNDHTLEGLVCSDVPAFSVQFHPEAAPGPTDAAGLFSRFKAMMENHHA